MMKLEDTGSISIASTMVILAAALVALTALLFFWWNPFREGEITVNTPDGTAVTIKVANSNEIGDLIENGLQNEQTAGPLTVALINIIENLPRNSPLCEKLRDLAERRREPFTFPSVPVKLLYGSNVPQGMVGVCDHSSFRARNIIVYVLSSEQELLRTIPLYANRDLVFPCPSHVETMRVSLTDIESFKNHVVLAKRAL